MATHQHNADRTLGLPISYVPTPFVSIDIPTAVFEHVSWPKHTDPAFDMSRTDWKNIIKTLKQENMWGLTDTVETIMGAYLVCLYGPDFAFCPSHNQVLVFAQAHGAQPSTQRELDAIRKTLAIFLLFNRVKASDVWMD